MFSTDGWALKIGQGYDQKVVGNHIGFKIPPWYIAILFSGYYYIDCSSAALIVKSSTSVKVLHCILDSFRRVFSSEQIFVMLTLDSFFTTLPNSTLSVISKNR